MFLNQSAGVTALLASLVLSWASALSAEASEDLRFNPAKAEGTVEVDWIRILDNTGATLRSWEY